jgi:Xaa-Pro aminopeptidase
MEETFDFIGQNSGNINEFQAQQFILRKFNDYGLKTDKDVPIVAFGENTSNVHYYPNHDKSKKLKQGDLVMIDIWARLNKKKAPFADITWMGYFGEKVPDEIQKTVDLVFNCRDEAVRFIKESLKNNKIPVGAEVDGDCRDFFRESRLESSFLHSTGHVLGINKSPHGITAGLRRSNKCPLLLNTGYTIEPGLYFEGKYGARSEINFYISKNMELAMTTEVQEKIVKIKEKK